MNEALIGLNVLTLAALVGVSLQFMRIVAAQADQFRDYVRDNHARQLDQLRIIRAECYRERQLLMNRIQYPEETATVAADVALGSESATTSVVDEEREFELEQEEDHAPMEVTDAIATP